MIQRAYECRRLLMVFLFTHFLAAGDVISFVGYRLMVLLFGHPARFIDVCFGTDTLPEIDEFLLALLQADGGVLLVLNEEPSIDGLQWALHYISIHFY